EDRGVGRAGREIDRPNEGERPRPRGDAREVVLSGARVLAARIGGACGGGSEEPDEKSGETGAENAGRHDTPPGRTMCAYRLHRVQPRNHYENPSRRPA